jgi:hypothetical protein
MSEATLTDPITGYAATPSVTYAWSAVDCAAGCVGSTR